VLLAAPPPPLTPVRTTQRDENWQMRVLSLLTPPPTQSRQATTSLEDALDDEDAAGAVRGALASMLAPVWSHARARACAPCWPRRAHSRPHHLSPPSGSGLVAPNSSPSSGRGTFGDAGAQAVPREASARRAPRLLMQPHAWRVAHPAGGCVDEWCLGAESSRAKASTAAEARRPPCVLRVAAMAASTRPPPRLAPGASPLVAARVSALQTPCLSVTPRCVHPRGTSTRPAAHRNNPGTLARPTTFHLPHLLCTLPRKRCTSQPRPPCNVEQ